MTYSLVGRWAGLVARPGGAHLPGECVDGQCAACHTNTGHKTSDRDISDESDEEMYGAPELTPLPFLLSRKPYGGATR